MQVLMIVRVHVCTYVPLACTGMAWLDDRQVSSAQLEVACHGTGKTGTGPLRNKIATPPCPHPSRPEEDL